MSENHGIVPREVVLAPPKAILKTASGKVARRPCHDAYLLGKIPVVFRLSSGDRLSSRDGSREATGQQQKPSGSRLSDCSDVLDEIVERCIMTVLELPANQRPAQHEDVFDLGLDSASAAELLYAVETEVGQPLTMDFLAKARTPAQMVRYLRSLSTTK